MRLSAPIFRLKRRARLLARENGLPLHEALDRIARQEGFRSWSHLAASLPAERPAASLLARLSAGDLVLLAARPGHGKTMLALELIVVAARQGRRGFFFTLEYGDADVARRLKSLGHDMHARYRSVSVDVSDAICAAHIIDRLRAAAPGDVIVIDYLQLLDQRRQNPALADQVSALKSFARHSGTIFVLLSQIDRKFEAQGKPLPGLGDVRLPNPLDLSLFSKACFLHEGEIRLDRVA
jgi:replicative DNA helicase